MGWLKRVEKNGQNHYVLPALNSMRTDVHAFLSEKLFAQTDEALWAQAAASASYPGAIGMYLMPDCHLGFGIPIGGVLITEDTIVQAGSGYDISCGVAYLRADGIHAHEVADPERRRAWVGAVERRVAVGVGSRRAEMMPEFSSCEMEDILRNGVLASGLAPGIRLNPDTCERPNIPVFDFDAKAIPTAYEKARPQLGSVGSGNHFIELQVDRDDGSIWAMIHCGSRGYGWQTANHFFHAGAELRGLPKNRREESWLRIDEPLGKAYWAHHNSAANYAVANRHVIARGVRQAFEEVFGCGSEVFYEISHNLVQEETLLLPDGTAKRGLVHRKGATRAFPAGHPDLVGTRWEKTGHPCLIPGSMLDGAAILFPLNGAYKSGCSVNHGSGRVMGRGQAKRELSAIHDEIDEEMRSVRRTLGPSKTEIVGVVENTERTPLDECGMCYKDLDDVLQVLEDEGIAKVHRRLLPVANIKGTG